MEVLMVEKVDKILEQRKNEGNCAPTDDKRDESQCLEPTEVNVIDVAVVGGDLHDEIDVVKMDDVVKVGQEENEAISKNSSNNTTLDMKQVHLLKLQTDGSYVVFNQQSDNDKPGTLSFNATTTGNSTSTDVSKEAVVVGNSGRPLVVNRQMSEEVFWESLSRMVKKELFEHLENSSSKTQQNGPSKNLSSLNQDISRTPGSQPALSEIITVTVSDSKAPYTLEMPNVKDCMFSKSQNQGISNLITCKPISANNFEFGVQSLQPKQVQTPGGVCSSLHSHQGQTSLLNPALPHQAAAINPSSSISDFRGSFSPQSVDSNSKSMAWYLVPPHCFAGTQLENVSPVVRQVAPPGQTVMVPKFQGVNVGYEAGSTAPYRLDLPSDQVNTTKSSSQSGEHHAMPDADGALKRSVLTNEDEGPSSKVAHVIDLGDVIFEKTEQAGSMSKYDVQNRRQHNAKEKARRARVKVACDLLRSIVPGLTSRTDKATVFEYAYEYIRYLKVFAPRGHEKDFYFTGLSDERRPGVGGR